MAYRLPEDNNAKGRNAKEAGIQLGLPQQNIGKVILGMRNQCGGFEFKRKEVPCLI